MHANGLSSCDQRAKTWLTGARALTQHQHLFKGHAGLAPISASLLWPMDLCCVSCLPAHFQPLVTSPINPGVRPARLIHYLT